MTKNQTKKPKKRTSEKEKNMDAKLIGTSTHGLELRYATRKTQVWPGYDCPLSRCGLWVGNGRRHTLVSEETAQHMGFSRVEKA